MAIAQKSEPSIQFDLFELDPRSCHLRRAGVSVDLPRQAVRVLSLLAARPNELITRKEIKEALWPDESHGDFDSRLNFVVKKLREGLGDSAEQPRYVQTVRNAGYMFIAPVRVANLPQEGDQAARIMGAERAELSGLKPSIALDNPRQFRLGSATVMVGVIVLAIAAAAFVFVLRREKNVAVQAASEVAALSSADNFPRISSVTPIAPRASQKIVISGRGFGLHVPYAHTDSPYLAIRDQTRDWAAGRMIPQNWDEVMVDVESWTTDQIAISGFSGDYGRNGWDLHEGDTVEIAVWNPQTGAGPARIEVRVGSSGFAAK